MQVLIIGAGPMAIEYAKVLTAQNIPYTVIGRSEASAKNFSEKTGVTALTGGYEQLFSGNQNQYTHAIVAVGEKWLGDATRAAIKFGIKDILVEKPGGIDTADIRAVQTIAKEYNAQVYVGYNRRFYASVEKAKQIIADDGGLLSFNFEFTEWGHVISGLEKEEGVKQNWFLANSSHIIDLAFYLGGKPRELTAYTAGSLDWHPRAAIYAGSGKTEQGCLFSYQANWQAPGRWALEFLTSKHRLYFRPVEKLQIQKLGSVQLEDVVLDDALDFDFKAGIYREVEAFMNKTTALPTLDEQVEMLEWYEKINKSAL